MNPAYFFYASLDKDVDYIKKDKPIKFKSVIDQNQLYDQTTGRFKPSVQGWYYFNFTIGSNNTNQVAAARLEVSSKTIANAVTDKPESTASIVISQASNQAIVYMQATDTAQVVIADHDTGPIAGHGYTTFTGFLMKED